jgi:hypothetical protein
VTEKGNQRKLIGKILDKNENRIRNYLKNINSKINIHKFPLETKRKFNLLIVQLFYLKFDLSKKSQNYSCFGDVK